MPNDYPETEHPSIEDIVTEDNSNNHFKTVTSNAMETNKENQEVTITGYFGKERKFNYKFFEESSKSAINTKIYFAGKDKELQSVKIKAFNGVAERLKDTLQDVNKEGVKKIEVTGKFKDVSYETKDKKQVNEKELQVSDFVKFKVMEIQGNISKITPGETPVKKNKYTELLVMNDTVVGGQPKTETFKVTVWENNKKNIPADVKLEVGKQIAVKGEASILDNKTDRSKHYISIDAWNIDQNMKKLHEQVAEKQTAKAKPQDMGIGM